MNYVEQSIYFAGQFFLLAMLMELFAYLDQQQPADYHHTEDRTSLQLVYISSNGGSRQSMW